LIVRASHGLWQASLFHHSQQTDFLKGCPK
jgi:hypothetical protein